MTKNYYSLIHWRGFDSLNIRHIVNTIVKCINVLIYSPTVKSPVNGN